MERRRRDWRRKEGLSAAVTDETAAINAGMFSGVRVWSVMMD